MLIVSIPVVGMTFQTSPKPPIELFRASFQSQITDNASCIRMILCVITSYNFANWSWFFLHHVDDSAYSVGAI